MTLQNAFADLALDASVQQADASVQQTVVLLTTLSGQLTALDVNTDGIEALLGQIEAAAASVDLTALEGLVTAGNALLATINGKIAALGQAAMAASSPVVIASDQSAVPVSGTVAVSNPGLTDTELRAAAVPITGATIEAGLASILAALTPSSTVPTGMSAYRNISTLNVGSVIKASQGKLYTIAMINNQVADRFVKVYNTAGVPTAADTPVFTFGLSSADGFQQVRFEGGVQFSNGIGIRATTGVTDTNDVAPAANNVIVNIGFR